MYVVVDVEAVAELIEQAADLVAVLAENSEAVGAD